MGITIEVRNNNIEKALRVLKKKLNKDGQMKELKQRQYYQKTFCDKTRRKKKEGIRRHIKEKRLRKSILKENYLRYMIVVSI